jgi:hypothetical protein
MPAANVAPAVAALESRSASTAPAKGPDAALFAMMVRADDKADQPAVQKPPSKAAKAGDGSTKTAAAADSPPKAGAVAASAVAKTAQEETEAVAALEDEISAGAAEPNGQTNEPDAGETGAADAAALELAAALAAQTAQVLQPAPSAQKGPVPAEGEPPVSTGAPVVVTPAPAPEAALAVAVAAAPAAPSPPQNQAAPAQPQGQPQTQAQPQADLPTPTARVEAAPAPPTAPLIVEPVQAALAQPTTRANPAPAGKSQEGGRPAQAAPAAGVPTDPAEALFGEAAVRVVAAKAPLQTGGEGFPGEEAAADPVFAPPADVAEAPAATDGAQPAPAAAPAASQLPTAVAGAPAPQAHAGTAAALAAHIARRFDGKASRFEVQLDPMGLGQVTVSVRIDAQGRLSAALAFDNPAAAAQLQARSAELRANLEQAGFDLSQGGLSFDSAGGEAFNQGGFAESGREQAGALVRGRAFGSASDALQLADLAAASPRRAAASGLDLRI